MFSRLFSRVFLIVVAVSSVYCAAAQDSISLSTGETLLDPTKPKFYEPPKKAVKQAQKQIIYKLNYVLASPGRKYAVINGEKVSVGGSVSGARVVSIDPQSVTLSVAGVKRTLTLNQVKGIRK